MANASDALDREIAFFNRQRKTLETDHMGKWVVICDEAVVGVYDALPAAARDGERRCGTREFLLRQVGFQEEMAFPVSLIFNRGNAGR